MSSCSCFSPFSNVVIISNYKLIVITELGKMRAPTPMSHDFSTATDEAAASGARPRSNPVSTLFELFAAMILALDIMVDSLSVLELNFSHTLYHPPLLAVLFFKVYILV